MEKEDGKEHILFSGSLTSEEMESDLTFQALQAIQEECTPLERALNYKEQGNEFLQNASKAPKRKLMIENAISHYSRGLEEPFEDQTLRSALLNNRAQAHFQLRNFRSALVDSERVLDIDSAHEKAHYRVCRCLLELEQAEECLKRVDELPHYLLEAHESNAIWRRLRSDAEKKLAELEERRVVERKLDVVRETLKKRNVEIMEAVDVKSRLLMGGAIDVKSEVIENVLHMSMLVMYDHVGQVDFIEKVPETSALADQLIPMFPPFGEPCPWDPSGDVYNWENMVFFYLTKDGIYRPWDKESGHTLLEFMTQRGYALEDFLCIPIIHAIPGSEKEFVRSFLKAAPKFR